MKRILAITLFAMLTSTTASAEGYKFDVKNSTDQKMVHLLVSQDGKTWSEFDLGGGIAAGKSGTMEWSEASNNQSCEQQVKAVYADKSESEPASFDFCEKDLSLEF